MKIIYKLSTSDANDIFFKDAKTEIFTDHQEAYNAYRRAQIAGKIGNICEVKLNDRGEEICRNTPVSL